MKAFIVSIYLIALLSNGISAVYSAGNSDIHPAKNGTVKGVIEPPEANVIVTITANGKSFSTKTNLGGEFLIEEVPGGTYAISFSSAAWIYKANLSEVIVTSGMITDLGTVNVSQP